MHSPLILCFIASDAPLGKIDKASLSQQTLMELLVEGFTQKEKICGSNENAQDISEWRKVLLNSSHEVIEFDWSFLFVGGTIELKWLPQALRTAELSSNDLTGTVDFTCLPEGLEGLFLRENLFEGTVDLTMLPRGLKYFYLDQNQFHGKTDFSRIPKSLIEFHVENTHLEGEIVKFYGSLGVHNSNVKYIA